MILPRRARHQGHTFTKRQDGMFLLPAGIGLGVGPGYLTEAIDYDGTNDWIQKSIASNLFPANTLGTLSVYFELHGGDNQNMYLFNFAAGYLSRTAANQLELFMAGVSNQTRIFKRTNATFLAGSGWHSYVATWDLVAGTPVCTIAIDNAVVSSFSSSGVAAGTVLYSINTTWGLAASNAGLAKLDGCLSEFVFTDAYLGPLTTDSNLRKIVRANGKPADKGVDGGAAFGGTAARMYAFDSNMMNNAGSTADWTTFNGSLTACASSPTT